MTNNQGSSPGLIERGAGWVVVQFGLMGAIAVAPPALGWLPSLPAEWQSTTTWLGLASGATGGVLAMAAVWKLGSSLTALPYPKENGQLTQHGVYRWVRHPIYTGVLFAALGWSLLRGSTPALLLTLALGVLFDQKANREEQWLVQKYPEYQHYQQQVRKLIPWLY
jgi:protein-S-isoprenylcysteine O-methyltransferase Ste14